jgi:histidinol-phosphate aminotransferase
MNTQERSNTDRAGSLAVSPSPGVAGVTPYRVPRPGLPIDLHLDGNEGLAPPTELLQTVLALGPEALRRYPSTRELEGLLAHRYGVDPCQVVVTGGADDALDRACRAVLAPGRELILPVPSFEMLERYPRLVGAEAVPIPWPCGAFPTAQVLAAVRPQTGAIAVVTPNNPTGAVATAEDLQTLSTAAPQTLLIVDLAYTEFADVDLMETALRLPNAVAIRTFSKAWGLAGLRVGYAVGPLPIMDWLRAAGSPYPTSGLSLALAAQRIETGAEQVRCFVERVRAERTELARLLQACGARPLPSQANFVLAFFGDAPRVGEGLAQAGIAVRGFPGRTGLENSLRITCPGEAVAFARLGAALDAVHASAPAAFPLGERPCA